MIAMFTCPVALGLPWTISGEKIEGVVERIEKPPAPFTEGLSVVTLTEASGIDRNHASELFRVIRRSGYQSSRKTLRKNEIVIVLPDEQAKKIGIKSRIRIPDYVAVILDEIKILHTAKAGRIAPVEK